MIGSAGLYLHATRIGKFQVWDEILDGLRLRGDETLLDLGVVAARCCWPRRSGCPRAGCRHRPVARRPDRQFADRHDDQRETRRRRRPRRGAHRRHDRAAVRRRKLRRGRE
ncbi:putative methyltransferase small domain protein [Mycobacterium xenopi 4042]|uniref:Putative methyltransferase small domain protein n=1 Tax=Mycobacterium xenopi 4042 TaxID=1299334 RepID=X7YIS3_MYCXE|nr:putative methyltransferase small domain protein [Mycobacterium xenopi 4042]